MGTRKTLQKDHFPGLLLRELRTGFGGADTHRTHPTKARPFARNTPIHIVLRSEKATGERSFVAKARKVEELLNTESARVGAKVLESANSANHVHIVMSFRSPQAQRRFLRTFSARLARLMLGAKKGAAKLRENSRFFAGRPFTYIARASKQLALLRRYLVSNRHENLSKIARATARQQANDFEELGFLCFRGGGLSTA